MITHLFVAACFIFGIRAIFLDGMLLGSLRGRILDGMPDWAKKPLYACPACMASVYGTLYFFAILNGPWLAWVFFCVALCGLNWMIMGLVSRS